MTTYTVKSGDWISKIAQDLYGTFQPVGAWDPVKAIAAANPSISDINRISPGQVINIPDKPADQASAGGAVDDTAKKSGSSWGWYLLAALGVGGAIYAYEKYAQKSKEKQEGLSGNGGELMGLLIINRGKVKRLKRRKR